MVGGGTTFLTAGGGVVFPLPFLFLTRRSFVAPWEELVKLDDGPGPGTTLVLAAVVEAVVEVVVVAAVAEV